MATAIERFAVAGSIAYVQGVVETTNEGGGGAPPAPIDSGELRGSPRLTVNSPSSEVSAPPFALVKPSDIARAVQLGGFTLGDLLLLLFIAAHANIIEGGRRLGEDGRMLGSEQAPDGFLWPAIETQQSRWRYRGGSR